MKRDGYGRPISPSASTDTVGNVIAPMQVCSCGKQDSAGRCEHIKNPVLQFPMRTEIYPSFDPECA